MIIKIIQSFKVFDSTDECLIAHSKTLDYKAYANAEQFKNDPYQYLKAIASIYATDSGYYDTGVRIMNKHLEWDGKP